MSSWSPHCSARDPLITTAFLDRDGVINQKAPDGRYITRWDDFSFLPGAVEALRLLTASGIRTIIVTNQRGVATRAMTRGDLDAIHDRMVSDLALAGARIDGIFVCPHDIGECDCRKPAIGLFRQAHAKFPDVDFASSIMVGDSRLDVEAGNRAGCRTYLVGDPDQRSRLVGSPDLTIEGDADTLLDIVGRVLAAGD